MTLSNSIIIFAAASSILGILTNYWKLLIDKKYPFFKVEKKPRKKISTIEVFMILIILLACIAGVIDQVHKDSKEIATKTTNDSLNTVQKTMRDSLFKLQDSLVNLNKINIKMSIQNYDHSTRIKDSLRGKLDTLRGENHELSKQQFKSFESTYQKIKQSADTLNAYLTGIGGYCYLGFTDLSNGKFDLTLINPKKFKLPGGYLLMLDEEKIDSIKTSFSRTGIKTYNREDFNKKYSKRIDFNSVTENGLSLNNPISYKSAVLKKYVIYIYTDAGNFAQQIIFIPSLTSGVTQINKCYRAINSQFIFTEVKVIQGQKLNINWEKEFTHPLNLPLSE